jgi:hypothetical protein
MHLRELPHGTYHGKLRLSMRSGHLFRRYICILIYRIDLVSNTTIHRFRLRSRPGCRLHGSRWVRTSLGTTGNARKEKCVEEGQAMEAVEAVEDMEGDKGVGAHPVFVDQARKYLHPTQHRSTHSWIVA